MFIHIQKITLNLIQASKITVYNTKHTPNTKLQFQKPFFFFSLPKQFIKISVFRLFVWPAFGVPKILVYIYMYIYIYIYHWILARGRPSRKRGLDFTFQPLDDWLGWCRTCVRTRPAAQWCLVEGVSVETPWHEGRRSRWSSTLG